MRALVPFASVALISVSAACGPSSGSTSSDGGTGGSWRQDTGGTGSTIVSWGGGDNAGAGGVPASGGAGGATATGGGAGTASGGGGGSAPCSSATAATLGSNSGDTSTGTNALSASCVAAGGKEQLFTFTPATSGTLTVTVTPGAADLGVYVFTNCSDESGSELLCANAGAAGAVDTGNASVTAGAQVFIAVDSASDTGAFVLDVSVN